ncbi:MAG: hypothetical protein FJW56_01855 [Actinobacteria bacterium]|nr:hypothetical protein [Actinomycetota bacterium]
MRTRKNFASIQIISIFVLLCIGCGTSLKVAKTPLVVPDFEFSPPSPQAPGSSGIKIGLLEPIYSGNFLFSNNAPFKQFRKSMGGDFEEILTSRGYFLKGPFESYDLMTYSDKNECDLGLDIEIDLNIKEISGGWDHIPLKNYGYGITSGGYSQYSSTLNLSGKITISIIETFTRQKLIVKSVPVPQEDITVIAEAEYKYGSTGLPLDDPGVHNPIANSLSSFYKTTMKRGWDMLANEELEHVRRQVPEIREKAGFIKR